MAFGSAANLTFDILARDNASGTFDRIGHSAKGTYGPLSGLGSKLKSVAKYGALAAAAGAVLAAKWGIDAVKAAAKDQQAQELLKGALQRNAGATRGQVKDVEKWIASVGRATGVTDDELRPALGRLVTATKDVGKAQDLARLAMDVSAGTGKSLESVSTALMKAQNGNVSSLSRLGIKTKDAEGNTLSLKEVTKQLADTYGGAAADKADTFQGKMDRLKLIYDETKEAIGSKLLPVLSDLGDWFLSKGIPAISKTWGWLKEKLGPVFSFVGDAIRKVIPFLQDIGQRLGNDLPGFTADAKAAFKDAQPFFQAVGEVFQNLVGPAIKWVADHVLPSIGGQLRIVAKAFGAIGKAFTWTWNNVLQPVFKFMILSVARVLDTLGRLFQVLGSFPGAPKWIGETGDKMRAAADETRNFADQIKKIPRQVNVNVHTTYTYSGLQNNAGPTRGRPDDFGAPKTSTGSGSGKMAGSSGRLSGKASSTDRLIEALARGMEVRMTGPDPGMRAYLQTGGSSRY